MKKKTIKRIALGVTAVVVGCGIVWGILVILRNTQKKPANVYSVSDFAITDYWGDTSETEGLVTTDKLQKIMISDTQKVKEVYVQEGQTVANGTPLLSYDTTLSDLEVKKAEIELQRSKLQLTMAEKELNALYTMQPHSSVEVPAPEVEWKYTEAIPYLIREGGSTKEEPCYYLWQANEDISKLYADLLSSEQVKWNEENVCWVVLLEREGNALNGRIEKSTGFCFKKNENEISLLQFYAPEIPEEIESYDEQGESTFIESGSQYTAAELSKLRDEKAQEIKDLQVTVKLNELNYKKVEKEAQDGTVTSTIVGTVIAVRDPEEAYKNGEPVVEVSGGGGYYINGSMSELEFGVTEVGQTVQINSWMTGTVCEGTITEIYTYPKTNYYGYTNGNTNVSYYPFRIFVDESADLQEGEYVNIQYQSSSQETDSMYLENQFLRTENGQSYVYVRNEKDLLEKRTVRTGKSIYGSYTEIKGGLTVDDYVAFPYGKSAYEGAKTKESTVDEFYGY